jgi:hypothetical protein
MKGGLRGIYRTLDLPGANPLKTAHADLDRAVLAAYGFDPKGDALSQLFALNEEVAAKIQRNEVVLSPGIPETFPNPDNLITHDCIASPLQ